MITEKVKQKIKFSLIFTIIACVSAFAVFTVIKYEVEGEKNMPFNLGKIIVISSAVTTENTENIENAQTTANTDNQNNTQNNNTNESLNNENNTENVNGTDNLNNSENEQNVDVQPQTEEKFLWEEKVVQTNDVYIYLDKNINYEEEEIIKNVKIENIQILQNAKLGKIQVYMPTSLDNKLFEYTKDFLINSSLTYKGALADNKKNLEIGNQGGCICLSFANVGLNTYKSNEGTELEQGAKILEKMNVSNEDLKFKVSFDLIIEVSNKSYKANIKLDLPVDELVGNKETHKEITNFEDVIFKRF